MVQKYIRKLLRERAAKAEEVAKLANAGNLESMEQKGSSIECQELFSPMVTDDIAQDLDDDEPPDLQALAGDAEFGTFIKFGSLAEELRLKIWKYALPTRRILRIDGPESLVRGMKQVKKDNQDGLSELYELPKYGLIFSTTDANLSMLSACKESRHVAVKAYPIHLPSEDRNKEIRISPHDLVVIGNIERILMTVGKVINSNRATFTDFTVLQGLQHLAFVAMTEDDEASVETLNKQQIAILTSRTVFFIPLFPNLQIMAIICDPDGYTSGGSLEGFGRIEEGEYDEDHSSLIWDGNHSRFCYESIRASWQKQHNVSYPPMEVLTANEYMMISQTLNVALSIQKGLP
ncbi:hypothetical protein BKA64DRAFT_641760 [Cadophora sp. MPI-SDFR-AT-0126]|nr:hypothetical protein BKA64DRAFT_641760 [Leotiomycetes sp. MPI-SDFR-AT-0126]